MQWYTDVLKKYTVFSGRARRKEYWMFVLINTVISFILSFIDRAAGTLNETSGLGLISGIYGLAVLLPSIAVGVRRLHDTNRTGWLLLLVLIPIVGAIIIIVFAAQEGHTGDNQYGPDPKAAERTAAFPGGEPPLPPLQ